MAGNYEGLGPPPELPQVPLSGGDYSGLGPEPSNQPQPLAPRPALLVEQQNIAKGVGRGLLDIPEGGAQLAAHGAAAVSPRAQPFADAVDAYIRRQEATYNKGFPSGQAPTVDLPRAAGNMIATAPVAYLMPGAAAEGLGARVLSGAASGAVSGAVQPVTDTSGGDYGTQKAEQVGAGAVGGAAGPVVGSAAGRVISPNASVNPNVQALRAAGVKPSLGQTLGGVANTVEEKLSDLPFVGDIIKGARYRGVETFNRSVVDRALAPIGESLSPRTPVGRQAIAEMHDKISSAYDALLPNISFQADPVFVNNISAIPTSHLLDAQKQQLGNVLREQFRKLGPNGIASGETFKEIDSKIGQLARDYSNAADPDQRNLGRVYQQVQTEMRAALARNNPSYAPQLNAINSAYGASLRVQGAASNPGAKEGVFTPAQFSASVRSLDPSLRKGAFARGQAPMQDMSDAGRAVLDNTVPNSGTPGRALMTGAASLAAAAGSGHIPGGEYALPLLAAGAAGSAAYTGPGQAILRAAVAARPRGAPTAAAATRGAGRALSPVFGPAFLRAGDNE